jgi:hypothetical protein
MQPRSRLAAIASIVVIGGFSVALAHASWSTAQTAGPMSLAAAIVAPPTGLGATRNCVRGTRNWIVLRWTATASSFADGYEIFRSTGGGATVSLGTVLGQATAIFRDKTVAFSTAYSYTVQTSYGAWRSVDSNSVAITTPNNLCR